MCLDNSQSMHCLVMLFVWLTFGNGEGRLRSVHWQCPIKEVSTCPRVPHQIIAVYRLKQLLTKVQKISIPVDATKDLVY